MPLLYKTTHPLLGIWKLDESADELRALLPESEWAELLAVDGTPRLQLEARRKEWMSSRLLLKELLGRTCGIKHAASGVPLLDDGSYHISISHTRGYVAVLLSAQGRTGIDIEYYSERVKKIRLRFLSPEEEAFILPQFETEQLLLCWCAKETLYKIAGLEDIDFSCHLHVRPFRFSSPEGFLTVYETKTAQQNRYILRYEVRPEYILTYLAPEALNFK